MNVPLSLTTSQAAAMDQYRYEAHYETRSAAFRAAIRAGLATLAASATSTRERDAAAAALALWDADDASTIPPQDPQP